MDCKPQTNLLNGSIESAVIVLHEEMTDSLVLTKRSMKLRDHPGDICFPGGRWQVGDTDLWMTALRELHEELGIDAHRLHFVKKLNIERTLNGLIIHPWLATIATLQPCVVNENEVAAVIKLPMHDVKKSFNYKEIMIERDGCVIKSCQFTASYSLIWGATARIMKQLCNDRELS